MIAIIHEADTQETMTQKRIKQWVDALRSGKYKQGKGRLYDPVTNSHCCMGVLCVVVPGCEFVNGTARYGDLKGYGTPPFNLLKDVGLTTILVEAGVQEDEGHPQTLAHLNDYCNLTFPQIADLIEAQL